MRVEGYYKAMQDVIAYEPGTSYTNTGSFEENVTTGRGWSYGAELFVQKRMGRTTGWLGYTLSWAGRQFDAINDGAPFPHRYDRRHSFSAVVTHRLSERFDFSGTWVYRTGRAETLPKATYRAANGPIDAIVSKTTYGAHHYGQRNGFRMPTYHRLDLGVNWRLSRAPPDAGDHASHTLSFGLYNAYNRQNVSFLHSVERTDERATAHGFTLLRHQARTYTEGDTSLTLSSTQQWSFESGDPVFTTSELDCTVISEGTPRYRKVTFSDEGFANQTRDIVMTTRVDTFQGERRTNEYTAVLYSISDSYFRFLQSLGSGCDFENPFSEPEEVQSNVEGGFGIFAGSSTQREVVYRSGGEPQ